MTDFRLRKLERRWKETGAIEDEAAYLRERVHRGEVTQDMVKLAALLGSPGAGVLSPSNRPEGLSESKLAVRLYQLMSLADPGLLSVAALQARQITQEASQAEGSDLPLLNGQPIDWPAEGGALEELCRRLSSTLLPLTSEPSYRQMRRRLLEDWQCFRFPVTEPRYDLPIWKLFTAILRRACDRAPGALGVWDEWEGQKATTNAHQPRDCIQILPSKLLRPLMIVASRTEILGAVNPETSGGYSYCLAIHEDQEYVCEVFMSNKPGCRWLTLVVEKPTPVRPEPREAAGE